MPSAWGLASTVVTQVFLGRPGMLAVDVRPGLAAVPRHLHVAVVGAHPEDVLVLGRLRDAEDRAVVLGRRVVEGEAARLVLLLLRGVVGREVGGDALPGVALVARAEEELRGVVEGALLVRAQVDGGVPVEAVLGLPGLGRGLDVLGLQGGLAHAVEVAALDLVVDHVGVLGVDEGPEPVAGGEGVPVLVADGPRPPRGSVPGGVVLQAAVDVVRPLQVEAHVVELRHGQGGHEAPARAAVLGDGEPAVVADDHLVGVLGVDPDRVHVGVVGQRRRGSRPRRAVLKVLPPSSLTFNRVWGL